jgi:hypothetical protein
MNLSPKKGVTLGEKITRSGFTITSRVNIHRLRISAGLLILVLNTTKETCKNSHAISKRLPCLISTFMRTTETCVHNSVLIRTLYVGTSISAASVSVFDNLI